MLSKEESWASFSTVEALRVCWLPRWLRRHLRRAGHSVPLLCKTLTASARCRGFLLCRLEAPDFKGNVQSQCWHFKKKTLKPKWFFSPSVCFGIRQSQTRGKWWHPKSLWLIHAGPQDFALSATWWSSYYHLVLLHSQKALPRIPAIACIEIGLSTGVSYSTILCKSFILSLTEIPLHKQPWLPIDYLHMWLMALLSMSCSAWGFRSLFQCFCTSRRLRWQEIGAPQRSSNCDKWDYVRLFTYRKQYKRRKEATQSVKLY